MTPSQPQHDHEHRSSPSSRALSATPLARSHIPVIGTSQEQPTTQRTKDDNRFLYYERLHCRQFYKGQIGFLPHSELINDLQSSGRIATPLRDFSVKDYPFLVSDVTQDAAWGFCIHSSGGKGLEHKPYDMLERSVLLKNHSDIGFDNCRQRLPPLEVEANKMFTARIGSYVDLFDRVRIPLDTRFQSVGRLTRAGIDDLRINTLGVTLATMTLSDHSEVREWVATIEDDRYRRARTMRYPSPSRIPAPRGTSMYMRKQEHSNLILRSDDTHRTKRIKRYQSAQSRSIHPSNATSYNTGTGTDQGQSSFRVPKEVHKRD